MADLDYSPALPAPKRQVSVTFSLTESGSDFIRVWCTVAPTGSELDSKINSANDPRNRYQIFEGSVSQSWNFTFDKGGKYTFVAQEYLKGAGYGGGYEGDPNGAANEELIGAESTLTIHIGQRVTQPVGPAGDQSTLVLWVWDDTIRETTKAFHGEDSPCLAQLSTTPRALTALQSASVETALANLIDVNVTTAIGNVSTIVSQLVDQINEHFADSSAHLTDDTANTIRLSFSFATSATELPKFVNQAIQSLSAHYVNDFGAAGTGVYGPDTAAFHQPASTIVSDRVNALVYQSVSSFGEAYGALADIYRSAVAHALNDTVHTLTSALGLSALPKILLVHSAYCAILASTNPAVPPAQSTGVQTLISSAGFK